MWFIVKLSITIKPKEQSMKLNKRETKVVKGIKDKTSTQLRADAASAERQLRNINYMKTVQRQWLRKQMIDLSFAVLELEYRKGA